MDCKSERPPGGGILGVCGQSRTRCENAKPVARADYRNSAAFYRDGHREAAIDFVEIAGDVARMLLGTPNAALSSKGKLRYGRRGSLCVDIERGVRFDHEGGTGGGVLNLVQWKHQCDRVGAMGGLEAGGFFETRITGDDRNGSERSVEAQRLVSRNETWTLLIPPDRLQLRRPKKPQVGWRILAFSTASAVANRLRLLGVCFEASTAVNRCYRFEFFRSWLTNPTLGGNSRVALSRCIRAVSRYRA